MPTVVGKVAAIQTWKTLLCASQTEATTLCLHNTTGTAHACECCNIAYESYCARARWLWSNFYSCKEQDVAEQSSLFRTAFASNDASHVSGRRYDEGFQHTLTDLDLSKLMHRNC